MSPLDGVWRLVQAHGWDEEGRPVPSPYGGYPMGSIVFGQGRMIASLCNGDADPGPAGRREYSSYGGSFTFDGNTLDVLVDVAADPARIGGHQVREARLEGDRLVLRPPMRGYGGSRQQRELVWQRVTPAPAAH